MFNIVQRIIGRLNGSMMNSDQRVKINRRLAQDKTVNIDKLYSERNYVAGARPEGDPRTWNGDNLGRGDTLDTDNITEQVGSTAINAVQYEPKTGECWVQYKTSPKRYHFVNMTPDQFKAYMQSGSKGQYTQEMRLNNHDPNYPITLTRTKHSPNGAKKK